MFSVPGNGEVRISVTPDGLIVIETELVVELAGLEESVAFTCIVEVPDTSGVPLKEQFALRVRPDGTVPPASVQV
jgi:hypothetical protein